MVESIFWTFFQRAANHGPMEIMTWNQLPVTQCPKLSFGEISLLIQTSFHFRKIQFWKLDSSSTFLRHFGKDDSPVYFVLYGIARQKVGKFENFTMCVPLKSKLCQQPQNRLHRPGIEHGHSTTEPTMLRYHFKHRIVISFYNFFVEVEKYLY